MNASDNAANVTIPTLTATDSVQTSERVELTTSRKPRRVYPYKGTILVCFHGRYFTPEADETEIVTDFPITKISWAGNAKECVAIAVTQRRPKRKGVSETWVLFETNEPAQNR